MPISYIGSATGTTSATLPSHEAGDLILAFAYRDGSTTVPTQPSGVNWSSVATANNGNTNSSRLGYKIAQSSSETTGTWTNATSVIFAVYRGVKQSTPLGVNAGTNDSSSTISFPALSLSVTNGSSWVVGFAGHRSTNVAIDTAPSSMINRNSVSDATDEAAIHDTDGGVTSWSAETASVGGTSSGWSARTVEILEGPLVGQVNLSSSGSITAVGEVSTAATVGIRITESGDTRITEASDTRITEKYLDGQTALTASGTMTAAGDITMGGVVHFGAHDGSSAATLTATGSKTQLGTSNLSSSGTLVVTGVRIQPGVVSLSSTGTIEAFGDIAAILESGSTNLQASGNLTTLGTLTLAGKVSLTTTGSKIVVAVNNMQGQFTGEATSTFTANGLKFIYVSKSFAATSSISVSGSKILHGATQLSAVSTISSSATNTKVGQTSLSASGSFAVIPSKKLRGTLNVTASLSSTVVGTRILFTSIAYVKISGVWTEVDPYAKHEAVWKEPEFMYKKISGAWKRIY